MKQRYFLKGKTILVVLLISSIATILIVFLTGLPSHRTIVDNSLISLSVLTLLFFTFLTFGLYKGLHIHDNLSHKLKWGFPQSSVLSNSSTFPATPISMDGDDGLGGILLSIVAWIAMTLLFILFLILLEYFLLAGGIALIALIYWILIRALKLIFNKSAECKGDLPKSITYASRYTVLYIGWIYGVIYLATLF